MLFFCYDTGIKVFQITWVQLSSVQLQFRSNLRLQMIMNGYKCTWPNSVPYNDWIWYNLVMNYIIHYKGLSWRLRHLIDECHNQQNIFSVYRLSDDETFVLLNWTANELRLNWTESFETLLLSIINAICGLGSQAMWSECTMFVTHCARHCVIHYDIVRMDTKCCLVSSNERVNLTKTIRKLKLKLKSLHQCSHHIFIMLFIDHQGHWTDTTHYTQIDFSNFMCAKADKIKVKPPNNWINWNARINGVTLACWNGGVACENNNPTTKDARV